MSPFTRAAAATALASALLLGSVPLTAAPALAVGTHQVAEVARAAGTSTVRTWAKRQYGTFPTWRRSGTGDDLLTLPKGMKAAVVTARTDGESNFIVQTLTAKNADEDLLVNQIGAYTGVSAFGLEAPSKGRRLQISADGDWTVVLKPVWKAAALPVSGSSDGAYLLNRRPSSLKLTHDGESNFILTQHSGGAFGWNLLANEIGDYRGTVPTEGGPSVVVVQADGDWTARFR